MIGVSSHQSSVIISFLLCCMWLAIYWRTVRPHLTLVANSSAILFWLIHVGLLLVSGFYIIDNYSFGHSIRNRWYYQGERLYNIPTLFAGAQLLFACALALTIALRNRPRSWLRTGYWLLFALGFFTLAMDETLLLHERSDLIFLLYLAGAAALSIVGIREARRHNQRIIRTCILWIFGGLFIAFAGGTLLDGILDHSSFRLCWGRLGGCFIPSYWEESAEFLGVWSAIVGLLVYAWATIPVSARKGTLSILLAAFLSSVVLLRALYWQVPRVELYTIAQPVMIENDFAGLVVLGYLRQGNRFNLYVKSAEPLPQRYGYSLVILDAATNSSLFHQDQWSFYPAHKWVPGRIYGERDVFILPAETPRNRALWLVLSFWRQEGEEYPSLNILASDRQQLSDTQVMLEEFVIPAAAAPLPEVALEYRFANGFALRGAVLPASATAGETLAIPVTWQADAASQEDWQQFLHFVHEETGALWNQDQPPLGARLPTRLWYAGLRDTESWQVPLPGELAPGRYAVYTGLYRLSDQARLPVSNAAGAELPAARVRLGFIEIGG